MTSPAAVAVEATPLDVGVRVSEGPEGRLLGAVGGVRTRLARHGGRRNGADRARVGAVRWWRGAARVGRGPRVVRRRSV